MNNIYNTSILDKIDDIIVFLFNNWKGYLSGKFWGEIPNKKTPEMLVAEYEGIIFEYKIYKSEKIYFPVSKKEQILLNNKESFLQKIIDIKELTALIFNFYCYSDYIKYLFKDEIKAEINCYRILIKKYEEIIKNKVDRIYILEN